MNIQSVPKKKNGCHCDSEKLSSFPILLKIWDHLNENWSRHKITKLYRFFRNSLDYNSFCPVSWGCRIHWLRLCRGVRPPPTNILDTTQNNQLMGVPVMLKLWQIRSTPLLPSLPSPLWPEVVAPDRVLSMGQIELNYILMLNWITWIGTVFDIETVLTLNWTVWNRADYLYKNRFGIK